MHLIILITIIICWGIAQTLIVGFETSKISNIWSTLIILIGYFIFIISIYFLISINPNKAIKYSNLIKLIGPIITIFLTFFKDGNNDDDLYKMS